MSENSGDTTGWYRETMTKLSADEVVVYAEPGPQDQLGNADWIRLKLQQGNDSAVLKEIIGWNHYVILSASVSDSGELIIDIIDPELIYKFKEKYMHKL